MSDVDDLKSATVQEPSMEDILSSIRRILSEDGASVDQEAGASDPVAPDPALEPAAAIAEAAPDSRTGNIAGPEGERRRPAAARRGSALEEIALSENQDDAPQPERSNVFHLTPDMRLPPERQVLSQSTSTDSSDVLSQLAKAILDRRDIGVGGRDMTIEGLVREMLRPLLREWLDRNLPYLIERLVKKEIDLMVNRAERLDD